MSQVIEDEITVDHIAVGILADFAQVNKIAIRIPLGQVDDGSGADQVRCLEIKAVVNDVLAFFGTGSAPFWSPPSGIVIGRSFTGTLGFLVRHDGPCALGPIGLGVGLHEQVRARGAGVTIEQSAILGDTNPLQVTGIVDELVKTGTQPMNFVAVGMGTVTVTVGIRCQG